MTSRRIPPPSFLEYPAVSSEEDYADTRMASAPPYQQLQNSPFDINLDDGDPYALETGFHASRGGVQLADPPAIPADHLAVEVPEEEPTYEETGHVYSGTTQLNSTNDLGDPFGHQDEKAAYSYYATPAEDYLEDDFSQDGFYDEKGEGIQGQHSRTASNFSQDGSNPHYGPAPMHPLARRRNEKKTVELTNGNLVLDCPIPTRLASFLPRKGEEEFTFMRYTAATCDPDDFANEKFTLRPAISQRETELFIGITMYNEDETLFTRTMHGVMKNIAHLCTRERSRTWGKDGWKKVVVCIIADGRKKIHPRVLDCLAALGVYQEGVAKNVVNQKQVTAHIYEATTQLSIDSDLKFKGLEKGIVPTQIVFCLKEKNAKKLNSHRWFFNAFAPLLQPNVCILIDVGTKPGPKSLYYLWKTFDLQSNVAGACGEICAMKGKMGLGLLNPLVAAQNFEYKMSNILDKPTESCFGYISVLPGAFSAYRYIALKNDEHGHGPLASYFKGETLAGYEADVFTSNMYLAEDRILCWELVAKRQGAWVLKYVKSAQGETDVPDQVPEFISQRRRWLNGSFFAAVYALAHFWQITRTDHSTWRKLALFIETFYNALNLAFTWFGLANYYIFFIILTSSLEDPSFGLKGIGVVNICAHYLYTGTLVACFLFAMGNRPQGSKWKYIVAMTVFALLTLYMMIGAVFSMVHAFQNSADSMIYTQIIISLIAIYGVYVFSITCMLQYLLFAPSYINVLNVFAYCNLHDFSWGTKDISSTEQDLGKADVTGDGKVEIVLPTAQDDIDGAYDEALHNLKTRKKLEQRPASESEKEMLKQDYYRNVRTNVVLAWALSNGILAAVILNGDQTTTFAGSGGHTRAGVYMVVILSFVALMSAIRFIGSSTYLAIRLFAG